MYIYEYLYICIVDSRNHRTFIFYTYAKPVCVPLAAPFNQAEIMIADAILFLCVLKFCGPFTNSSRVRVRVCACMGLCGLEQQSW